MGYLKEFTQAYIETALWSSTDESDGSGGEPLDANYTEDDLAMKAKREMAKVCADFVWTNRKLLRESGLAAARAGHNFWLNRNGHGAGFWDEGLGDVGDELSDACRPYGESYLYVGDDGLVHLA
jgi:hypothetical protein